MLKCEYEVLNGIFCMSEQTLEHSIEFSGIGGHSGLPVNVTVKPADVGTGIVFIRTDIGECIVASYKNVSDTRLCTVITNSNGASVSTIEHLMSAFGAFGIDNAIVEVDGAELPILDGSSIEYAKEFVKCGIRKLEAPKRYIKVLREVSVTAEDRKLIIKPSSHFSVTAAIEFDNPVIGSQKLSYTLKTLSYVEEIASARTFAFMKDLQYLQSIGLAKGASLEHGIGVSDEGVVNAEGLRFKDEFVRHKILDIIGDFALGGNIICHVEGYKMGHALNNAILHELFSNTMNYEVIEESIAAANNHVVGKGLSSLVHAF